MPPKCVRPAWLQAILKPRGDLLILAITSLKGRLRPDYHNCLGSAIYAARARLRDAECAGFRSKRPPGSRTGHSSPSFRESPAARSFVLTAPCATATACRVDIGKGPPHWAVRS